MTEVMKQQEKEKEPTSDTWQQAPYVNSSNSFHDTINTDRITVH